MDRTDRMFLLGMGFCLLGLAILTYVNVVLVPAAHRGYQPACVNVGTSTHTCGGGR